MIRHLLIALIPLLSLSAAPPAQAAPKPAYGYPIGLPERQPGDGFFIRHAYASENTWFNPGWWHTAEDWYALEGSTEGAQVYAVAAGRVVYAGSNYPGRVVIVEHADGLFSMYGHLDPALAVRVGDEVARGDLLGVVAPDGQRAPAHLHFEIRTFLTTRAVNGAAPRYRYACGVRCPPGPGYWPQRSPDHPGALGWRNPTHTIARRALPAPPRRGAAIGEVVAATQAVSTSLTLWSAPPGAARRPLGTLALTAGERLTLLEISAGPEDARGTGADAYALWYRVRLPDRRVGWVQAAVPWDFERGADGRASSVVLTLLMADAQVPPMKGRIKSATRAVQ